MQRFNTFNMIHKVLRAMLYDTALTLQRTYFGNEEEARSALEKVDIVVHQFEQHAHHEDEYILPAIAAYEPGLVEAFEQEHIEDHQLGDKLKHLLNMFGATSGQEERIIAGSAISKAFIDFLTFNLEHMAKEESVLNTLLWQYYTDEHLQKINAAIVAGIPADEKAITAKWMLRGINNHEAAAWLKGIRQTAPKHVFQSVLALAETELAVHRRMAITEATLTESEPVF